ncbi:MAG TPA: YtxH domain-containing protein [Candidatus Baltobacteraceae bacterium]|jgi:gas vesicle protein|nr:YtxH domain-containing protein [Candidatus Baltobacteraceae bacterium]
MTDEKPNGNLDHRTSDTGHFIWGFLTGALVGTALALAFSPKTGEETRDLLRTKSEKVGNIARDVAGDTGDRARAIACDLGVSASSLYDRGRQILAEARERVESSIEEGKSAAADERTRLEQDA